MSSDEVKSLIKQIKSLYPMFSDNEDTIYEWTKRLKNYSSDEVSENLEEYVREEKSIPPVFSELISGLKTLEEKEQVNKRGNYICIKCNKIHATQIEMERCYERDMSIEYITKMCKKFNLNVKDYFKDNLLRLSLEEINSSYDKFMRVLFKKQQEDPVLSGNELLGLRTIYKQVYAKGKSIYGK